MYYVSIAIVHCQVQYKHQGNGGFGLDASCFGKIKIA